MLVLFSKKTDEIWHRRKIQSYTSYLQRATNTLSAKKINKQIIQYGFCYKISDSSSVIATHLVSNSRTKCDYESFLCFSDASSKVCFLSLNHARKKTPKFLFDTFHAKHVFTRHSLIFFSKKCATFALILSIHAQFFWQNVFNLFFSLAVPREDQVLIAKFYAVHATKWIPTDKRRGPGATSKNQKEKGSL